MEDAGFTTMVVESTDTGHAVGVFIEGVTGDSMLPYLVAGLGALYSAGKAVDNVRYWNAYFQNTGRIPKYPFRSGAMDWMRDTATVGYGFGRLKKL